MKPKTLKQINKRIISIRRSWILASIATMLALAISRFIIYDISSISVFAPMEKSLDFEISDIYNSVAQRRMQQTLSDNIVIVSVDECPSRREIAEVIEAVDFFDPAAIGLDIFFNYPLADDDFLINTLKGCRNVVLPVDVADGNRAGSWFYNLLPDAHYGSINIGAESVRDVVRRFKPYFMLNDGGEINNIAIELANIASSESYEYFLQRNRTESHFIHYPSVCFDIVEPSEIVTAEGSIRPEAEELLRDKVVLVGNIRDESDMHLTPVGEMSGLAIHAYTLHTILDRNYINETSELCSWTMAVVISFIFVLICTLMKTNGLMGDNLWARIIQIVVILLFIWLGCKKFVNSNNYINFGPSLLMLGLGTLSLDICMGAIDIYRHICRRLRRKKQID